MTRSKTLSVMAVLSVIAIVTIIIVSKKDINLDEVTMECPSSIMRGAPTMIVQGIFCKLVKAIFAFCD